MRVSAKADYALRALIEIANRDDGRPVSAEELGRLQEIPHGFLQAILADMRRAGIVVSQRGQSGGWRLAARAARRDRRRRDPRRRRPAGQRLRAAARGGAPTTSRPRSCSTSGSPPAAACARSSRPSRSRRSPRVRCPTPSRRSPRTRTPGSRTDRAEPRWSSRVHLPVVDVPDARCMARRKLIWHIGLAHAPRPVVGANLQAHRRARSRAPESRWWPRPTRPGWPPTSCSAPTAGPASPAPRSRVSGPGSATGSGRTRASPCCPRRTSARPTRTRSGSPSTR